MNWLRHSAASPHLLGAGLALFLIFISFGQTETTLYQAWQTEEYSHGIVIPVIALLLAWHLLSEKRPILRPSWSGLAWLAVAACLQIISQLSAFEMAGEFGLVIAITAVSVAFFGRAATRSIAPALFYLVFAIPLPHLVQAILSARLQLLSSTLGVWPLDLFGVPVYQEGNVIDLGAYKLQVAEACSGLRYLFPLMSFGYLIAFLLEDKLWKRIIVFLSAIPITIGLNSLRIAFIGVTVDLWGQKMAEGFLHDFEGWGVFLICVAVLLGETWILTRIGSRGRFRLEYLAFARGPLFGATVRRPAPEYAMIAGAGIFAIVFASGLIDQRAEIVPQHSPMTSFPLALGDWRGRAKIIDADTLGVLKLSEYWMADYTNGAHSPPVNFYIAYYARQYFGTNTHSPSNCIPGGGWQIDNSRVETVRLEPSATVTFTRLLIRHGDAAELVYYWFDERGRDLTESYIAKWYLIWDSIVMHRTDGALVRLVTPVTPNETEGAAEGRLRGFLALAYPHIKVFIPGSTAINSIAVP